MSDELPPVCYTAFWVGNDFQGIPASSARSMIVDDARAARETQELAAFEVERREAEMMHAVRSGRARAGLAGVFAAAERYASAEDYRVERQIERERYAEPEQRYPGTDFEADRQLEQASRAHQDLVAYQMRQASQQGRAAGHIEAMRRDRSTAMLTATSGPGTEIQRYAPTPVCSGFGHVSCRCK